MTINQLRTFAFGSLFVGASLAVACGDDATDGDGDAGNGAGGSMAGRPNGGSGGSVAGSGGSVAGSGGSVAGSGGSDAGSGGSVAGTGGKAAAGGTAGSGGNAGVSGGGMAGVAGGGAGGMAGMDGEAGMGGDMGEGGSGGDSGGDLCGGCAVFSVPFTGIDQGAAWQMSVEDGDIDLTGATITARVQLRAWGNSGGAQFFARDVGGNTNWPWTNLSDLAPVNAWVNLTYALPASGSPDDAHIATIGLILKSGGWAGAEFATTTLWIDSITITPATGAAIVYGFDTGAAPMAHWFAEGGMPETGLSWVP